MKSENPTSPASPSALKAYFLASRPKTWIASLSPVAIGASMAPHLDVPLLILTLLFSLLIQIGTNYANDYFDFFHGADSALRIGPKRATQEGWIAPEAMRTAALLTFALALLIAIPLMVLVGLWSLFIAALCVSFGILYTGGPKPLGYLGLGEVLVLLFFGPVATCGTFFLQTGTLPLPVFIASLAPGFLCCSILIANNLRDAVSDAVANKRTLIVRLGPTFGCWEYTLSIAFAAAIPLLLTAYHDPRISFTSLIFPLCFPLLRKAFQSRDLPSLLPGTALLLFLYTLLFCLLW